MWAKHKNLSIPIELNALHNYNKNIQNDVIHYCSLLGHYIRHFIIHLNARKNCFIPCNQIVSGPSKTMVLATSTAMVSKQMIITVCRCVHVLKCIWCLIAHGACDH